MIFDTYQLLNSFIESNGEDGILPLAPAVESYYSSPVKKKSCVANTFDWKSSAKSSIFMDDHLLQNSHCSLDYSFDGAITKLNEQYAKSLLQEPFMPTPFFFDANSTPLTAFTEVAPSDPFCDRFFHQTSSDFSFSSETVNDINRHDATK